MMTPLLTELVEEAIDKAAHEAQAHLEREQGIIYKIEDLKQAFIDWLEISVEQLADEAMYHAFEAIDSFAFNRHTFKERLKTLKPVTILLT